jgi:hypothetical protein
MSNLVSHPLSVMYNAYKTPAVIDVNGDGKQIHILPYYKNKLDILFAEKSTGDMEKIIEKMKKLPNEQVELTLTQMTLMVFHCLVMLDCALGGYTHNDLGLRNVLFTP